MAWAGGVGGQGLHPQRMRHSHPAAGDESDSLSLRQLMHPTSYTHSFVSGSTTHRKECVGSFRPEQSHASSSIVAMPGRLFATLLACSVLFSLEAAAAPLVQNLQTAFPVECTPPPLHAAASLMVQSLNQSCFQLLRRGCVTAYFSRLLCLSQRSQPAICYCSLLRERRPSRSKLRPNREKRSCWRHGASARLLAPQPPLRA